MLDGTPDDVVARYDALAEYAKTTDFGILDRNVVVIDTETTGFSFTRDELIQIAAARIEQGEVVDWFNTFVNPGKPLPEEIIHLTNIHESDVANAPTPQEALAALVEFAGDAFMVAHNVGFDRTFVTRHPEGYPLLENVWIDTLDLSRIALPRLKSHRLIDLVHAFGAPTSTHRADDDVAATCVVYRILLAAVAHMPHDLVRAIGEMVPQEEWSTGLVFRTIANNVIGKRTQLSGRTSPPLRDVPNNIGNKPEENDPSTGADLSAHVDGPTNLPLVGADLSARPTGISDRMDGPTNHPLVGADLSARTDGSTCHNTVAADSASHKTSSIAEPPESDKPARFSLRTMRQRRVLELPMRQARKDADDLVGKLDFPTSDDIDVAFSAEGALGRIYADYEPREEQRSMAAAIAETFAVGENLVVEAGTGVGKSMAYLVPAALFAQRNGVSVGIATKTNSLLDQLVFQELPALATALEAEYPTSEPLTWAPLKGMAHYPCLRRINRILEEGPVTKEVAGTPTSQAPVLAALLSYIEQSEYDDIDALKIDYRALPRYQITTTSNDCLRRKCPFFGKLCFAHGARRRAELADIIVTNHTLLFCNVAADGGLLPPVRHWIIDEAHATEGEARSAFAESIDGDALMRIAHRVSSSGGSRNVFTRAERALSSGDVDQLTLFFALIAKGKQAGDLFAACASAYLERLKGLVSLDSMASGRKGRKQPVYDHVDIWINPDVRKTQVFADIAATANELIEATDKLIKADQDIVGYLEGIDEAAVAQRELASLAFELRSVRNAAELIFDLAPDTHVFQASVHRKKDRYSDVTSGLLLDVGEKMNESLYTATHSVIYTSATITVGNSFETFEQAVGLNRGEFSQARELQLDSSYDFDNNMIVYVVKDMPEPNEPSYLNALNKLLIRAHRAQKGSMLTLFTNRREMERSYEEVNPALKADDLRLVCQKYGVSVKGLRDEFLADQHLSLFALKSFWEGFDAPGATLRGVIIPKLPFARPTDPLYCERAARDSRAWWHYVLPQAVIETKQAAGRLIRKADDHGVLILADKRLVTKSYGKTFLNSLQSNTIRICKADEVIAALELMERMGG